MTAEPACSRFSDETGSVYPSDAQFCNAADSGDCTAGEVLPEVFQMHLQIGDALPLGDVVGILFKVAEPFGPVLPVHVPGIHHVPSLRFDRGRRAILSADLLRLDHRDCDSFDAGELQMSASGPPAPYEL